MKVEKKTLFEIMTSFFIKNGKIIAIITVAAIFYIIFINDISTDVMRYVVFALFTFIIILFNMKITNKKITFEDDKVIVEKRLLSILINRKKYNYNEITKFLIGRYYPALIKERNHYSIYIDKDNEIIKLMSVKSYKDCIEIIEKIKSMTTIRIYDASDTLYAIEEDLFRSYYKMKKMIDDIKNE